jgi:hypothetical protein
MNEKCSQLSQVQAGLDLAQCDNSSLLTEINKQQDYISILENRTYKANITSLELLRQLKTSEEENESLKMYIIDLKQKVAIYIPHKDDPIDKMLADYINNYPDRQRLKIMFLRES